MICPLGKELNFCLESIMSPKDCLLCKYLNKDGKYCNFWEWNILDLQECKSKEIKK